ncbi:DUF1704 domain-containing protein [Candidatus Woesearchaeota archaeon]|nr:DUF1704 domain-containing protein [Candidatus Woesearchaeota archaeon]
MNSKEELKEIDEVLTRIRSEFEDYSHITPINTNEEYELFVKKDCNYNPQLKYKEYNVKNKIEDLKKLKIENDSEIGKLFCEIKDYLLSFAEQFDNIGTDKFHTEHLFEPIDEETLDKAKETLDKEIEEVEESEKEISSQELGNKLRQELEKYGLNDWKINYNKNASSTVNVNGGKKKITIRDETYFSESHVQKLIIHEIGTHALRSENGRQQEYKIFSTGLPNYLSTEEGLASYNEEQQGVSNPHIIKRLARNVLMTSVASKGSFMDIYNSIRPYFEEDEEGDEKTFKMCVRIKRGLGDTKKPGGFLKDHAYFQGLCKIRKFVKEGGDLKKLYAGKIGIQHLLLLEKGVLKNPKIIPAFLE